MHVVEVNAQMVYYLFTIKIHVTPFQTENLLTRVSLIVMISKGTACIRPTTQVTSGNAIRHTNNIGLYFYCDIPHLIYNVFFHYLDYSHCCLT